MRRLRVADAAFAVRDAPACQLVGVGVHHVGAQDVQADEMFLTHEADFGDTVTSVHRTAVLHGLLKAFEKLPAQLADAGQGDAAIFRYFQHVFVHGFCVALHINLS